MCVGGLAAIEFYFGSNRLHVPPLVAQVAQVNGTTHGNRVRSLYLRLGDPEQRRPALRPLGYPTDCPKGLNPSAQHAEVSTIAALAGDVPRCERCA